MNKAVILWALVVCALSAAPTTVTISDTIYKPDGTVPTRCTLTIQGMSGIGTATAGETIVPARFTATITSGVVSLRLVADDAVTPGGTSYAVAYSSDCGYAHNETWVVPSSPTTTTIRAVRASVVPGPTVTFNYAQISKLGATSGQCLVFTTSWGPGSCATGGTGLSSLDGLTGSTQTFAAVNDTNLTLGIGSSGTAHTFTLGWTGALSKARQHANTLYSDGSYTDPSWLTLNWTAIAGKPSTFAPSAHASSHQHGGSDEVATATAAANAIPKAGSGGTLAAGWIPTLNQNTTGNAATATALAAQGTQCSAGSAPRGVSTAGDANNCTAYQTPLTAGTGIDITSGVISTTGTGHTQNTDTGTDSTTFQIDTGNSGPKLKNNAGVLEVRNAADSAYADLRVGHIVTDGPAALIGAEQAAPTGLTTPELYFDSTAHLPQYLSAASALLGTMVVPASARTANQFCTHVSLLGVCTTAAIAAADLPAALANSTSINGTAVGASKTILYTDSSAGSFPTLNQNTTGTAAGLTAQYIDYSASSGGNSIANKPTLPANTTSTTSQYFTAYNSTTGAFTKAQPACGDLSNSAASCSTDATNASNIASGTLAVARGGTGLGSGTSGGVLAYTASGTLASSGALTANLPVIGGGAGAAPSVGTRSGNTTAYVTTTGTQTSGRCVEIDANGNHIAAAAACSSGSGGITVLDKQGVTGTLTPNGSETTVFTKTITGGTLTTGDVVRIHWTVQHATGSLQETYKIYFGAQSLTVSGTSTANAYAQGWCDVRVTGSATQEMIAYNVVMSTVVVAASAASPTETISGDIIVKLTTNNASGADTVKGYDWTVEKL